MLTEERGGREDEEGSRGQIRRDLLCQTAKPQLYPAVKGRKQSKAVLLKIWSPAGCKSANGLFPFCDKHRNERVSVYKRLQSLTISMTSRPEISELI